MEQKNNLYPADKNKMYSFLIKQAEALLENEHHVMSNLSNASALLNSALPDINWVGFYILTDGELLLGPFQGNVACMHIAVGKGVCGSAVAQNSTILVENVHNFPGHIACDCASNSEIVIPLRNSGRVVGVLDIDSPLYGRFDKDDARWLEQIARVIENSCTWSSEL